MMPNLNRFIHCRFTSDTVLLLVAIFQMVALQITMDRNHAEAVDGREKILALEHKNEIALASHIRTAVDRWQSLRDHNRDLSVPVIPEPNL